MSWRPGLSVTFSLACPLLVFFCSSYFSRSFSSITPLSYSSYASSCTTLLSSSRRLNEGALDEHGEEIDGHHMCRGLLYALLLDHSSLTPTSWSGGLVGTDRMSWHLGFSVTFSRARVLTVFYIRSSSLSLIYLSSLTSRPQHMTRPTCHSSSIRAVGTQRTPSFDETPSPPPLELPTVTLSTSSTITQTGRADLLALPVAELLSMPALTFSVLAISLMRPLTTPLLLSSLVLITWTS